MIMDKEMLLVVLVISYLQDRIRHLLHSPLKLTLTSGYMFCSSKSKQTMAAPLK